MRLSYTGNGHIKIDEKELTQENSYRNNDRSIVIWASLFVDLCLISLHSDRDMKT